MAKQPPAQAAGAAGAAPIKILVCGDVMGGFASLMSKVAKVQASHGPFSLLLCVGQFFSSAAHANLELQPFLAGVSAVAVPTYFICGQEEYTALVDHMPDGGELCPGLHYLGRAGVKALAGLKVAYLSGVFDAERYFDVDEEPRKVRYEAHYTEEDALTLSKQAAGEEVDLLLTTEWGRHWHSLLKEEQLPARLSSLSLSPSSMGSPVVAKLANQLQLRYHFASHHDVYFELPPYTNHGYFTRFFALGRHGSKSKEKSLYACNITPAFTVNRSSIPATVTACPYTVTHKRDKPKDTADAQPSKRSKTPGFVRAGAIDAAMADPPRADEQLMSTRWDFTPHSRRPPPPHYICNICHQPGHWIQDCPSKAPPSADPDVPPPSYVCKKCQQPGHYIRQCPLVLEENAARAEERKGREGGAVPGDYRCRKCGGEHWIQRCPLIAVEEAEKAKRRGEGPAAAEGAGCWFCLATEGVAVHLIVSVGDECYLALAKGPLVPHHLLILPIVHVQAVTQMTPAQELEMNRYKACVTRFYASEGLRPVFYERNIPTRAGQHLHVQCVPVSQEQFGAALATIRSEAAALSIVLEELPADARLQSVYEQDAYIVFEVGDVRLGHRVVKGKVPGLFDYQRNALAKLLGQPDKGDWRNCQMSVEGETQLVDAIKEQFKPFDLSESQGG